jgi:D-alanyl-D-alanine carboxypeptidase
MLDNAMATFPGSTGSALHVYSQSRQLDVGAARGTTDRTSKAAMSMDNPGRIASVTKPFTAATTLRLAEEGKVDLDASIVTYASPGLIATLRKEYAVDDITVRQLLFHTSGMADYADTNGPYVLKLLAEPAYVWTRAEQVAFAVDNFAPLSAPGQEFHYSDTGYVMLGDIIEQASGLSYPEAMRSLLDFDGLGLTHTYLEKFESAPNDELPVAHFYVNNLDGFALDASYDLFGGGGLISTTSDLTRFFTALMQGKVFQKPETQATMQSPFDLDAPEVRKMSLYERMVDGHECWGHTGFGGTLVFYCPDIDVAVSLAFFQTERPPEFDLDTFLGSIVNASIA